MGVSEATLSIKPRHGTGKTKRNHSMDYLEQKNEVIKLKPQSERKNHYLPALTDVGLIAAIGVSFLRENPLDAFFSGNFQIYSSWYLCLVARLESSVRIGYGQG
jgi:hypothetical protein